MQNKKDSRTSLEYTLNFTYTNQNTKSEVYITYLHLLGNLDTNTT